MVYNNEQNDNSQKRYWAKNALQPTCGQSGTYWLGRDVTNGEYFVVDYGREVTADGFYVRNSNNDNHNDRSTGQFKVDTTSTDPAAPGGGGSWTNRDSGSFPTIVTEFCSDTLLVPATDGVITFRYARFTALTYHLWGASLSYFGVREVGEL